MATPINKNYSTPNLSITCGRYLIEGDQRIAIWGQSNAMGSGEGTDLSVAPLSADPELAQYWSGARTFSRVFVWTGSSYDVLTATNNGASAGKFAAEIGIGVRWMRETTSGNLYISKEAVSGASITTFEPNDPEWGWAYTARRNNNYTATAWLTAQGVQLAGDHFLWVQGEADSSQNQAWYQTRLQAMLDQRVIDGLESPAGIQVVAQIKPGTIGYGSGVAAAKAAIAAANPSRVKIINMDHYGPDNIHCNARGHIQLGYDSFEKIFNVPHIST